MSTGIASTIEWSAKGLRRLHLRIPPTVYPPRQDTTLLDSALADLGSGEGRKMLEIGCGSGAISIAAAMRGWNVTCCDINPLAVAATIGNAATNNVTLKIHEGGIETNSEEVTLTLPPPLAEAPFDLIVWNLPYLDPPEFDEPRLGPLEDAGLVDLPGEDGWSDKLLDLLNGEMELLATCGAVYLVHTSSRRGKLLQNTWREGGFATRTAGEVTLNDGEVLSCISAWRAWGGREITLVEEVDSTNRALLSRDSEVGDCLVARRQTEGRGQRARQWLSSDGDFTGSWRLDEKSVLQSVSLMQVRASLAVVDVFRLLQAKPLASYNWTTAAEAGEGGLAVHWPNDVWALEGKLSGCLVEGRQIGAQQMVVLGVGVNLVGKRDTPFPTISASDILGVDIPLEKFAHALDISISSLFEEGELLPSLDSNLKSLWQLMAHHLSRGRLLYCGEQAFRPCELAQGGELVVTDEAEKKVITDSYDCTWE